MKDDRVFLQHVLECIGRIEAYTAEGRDAFFADTKTQDAVLRNLQTLSESMQRLPDTLKQTHPQVDWRGIAGFRNILVHNYLGIRLERVWEIVELFIPQVKQHARQMLDERKG